MLIAAFWRVGLLKGMPPGVAHFVLVFMSINVALCLFNLIPLAPLDGSGVLGGLVGERGAQALASLQTYGPILLMGLFMMSYISPRFDIMGGILSERRECGHASVAWRMMAVAWLHRAIYRVRQFGSALARAAGRWRNSSGPR